MRRILLLAACLLTIVSASAQSPAPLYDTVILHGRVIDPETHLDGLRNVGTTAGKIAIVTTDPIQGKSTLDATGLVVAPGFIDLHSHGQDPENYRTKAMDGVTTALELEVGVWPVNPWYQARAGHALINYGASVGHIPVLIDVMHDSGTFLPRDRAVTETPTPAEHALVLADLHQGLADGALGIGMGLAYTPHETPADILRVFELAAAAKRTTFVHMRTPGVLVPGVVDSLQEMIADSAVTGAAVHIVHINSMANKLTPIALEMIHGAQARGLDVTTEAYPYTAGETRLDSGVFAGDWQHQLDISYNDLQWVATGERLTADTFARYRKQGGLVLTFTNTQQMVDLAMADPAVMIATDGILANGKGHPRAAGSYARLLGAYVRDRKILTLMEAIRRSSLAPAQRLEAASPAFHHKGRIQVGADADIAVFDPATVLDRATYANPGLYSTGFRYVLVNGTVVVHDGHPDESTFPGQGLRADPVQ